MRTLAVMSHDRTKINRRGKIVFVSDEERHTMAITRYVQVQTNTQFYRALESAKSLQWCSGGIQTFVAGTGAPLALFTQINS